MARITIGIIGLGHMGTALLEGLLVSGVNPRRIIVQGTTPARVRASIPSLIRQGVVVPQNARYLATHADIIFVTVKPGIVEGVLEEMRGFLRGKTVVSCAAGVPMRKLKSWVGSGISIARAMPNIPVAVGRGVIGLYAKGMGARSRTQLMKVLSGLGHVVDVPDEKGLDVLTVIAGCGPGIVSEYLSMISRAAKRLGLTGDTDHLAKDIVQGTLNYLEERGVSAGVLRDSVATKGGVTETILLEQARGGFEKSFVRALNAGSKRVRSIRS